MFAESETLAAKPLNLTSNDPILHISTDTSRKLRILDCNLQATICWIDLKHQVPCPILQSTHSGAPEHLTCSSPLVEVLVDEPVG